MFDSNVSFLLIRSLSLAGRVPTKKAPQALTCLRAYLTYAIVALLLTRAPPGYYGPGLCPFLFFQESVFHGSEHQQATYQIGNLCEDR